MIRLTDSPLRDFEVLCQAAGERDRSLGQAQYPPSCARPSGPVRFRALDDPVSIEIVVEPTDYAGPVAEVRQLFTAGSLRFSGAAEFHRFCHGPLAAAFSASPAFSAAEGSTELVDTVALGRQLANAVDGQDAAVERIAEVIALDLARVKPERPTSILLAGPPSTGKAAAIRALPVALAAVGASEHRLYEIDCRELSSEAHASTVLGLPPGFAGHDSNPPIVEALRHPRPIILLRDVEHAHPVILGRVVVELARSGRLRAPDGRMLNRPECVIAFVTSLEYEALEERLDALPYQDTRTIEQACRTHLVEHGVLDELVAAISAFAVFEPKSDDMLVRAAERAIRGLASEYGLQIDEVDRALSATVLDIADASGATGGSLRPAARDLLGATFADAAIGKPRGSLGVQAGPPPLVIERTERNQHELLPDDR